MQVYELFVSKVIGAALPTTVVLVELVLLMFVFVIYDLSTSKFEEFIFECDIKKKKTLL